MPSSRLACPKTLASFYYLLLALSCSLTCCLWGKPASMSWATPQRGPHGKELCEVFNVWVAAHGKHSHDPVSWDQLEPMSYICSSWGQLFTQTKNSIPKFRLYLCSIINYKKSMATVSFQGHKCYSEELESLRKIIKTHPPCECALLSCWKGLKNWVSFILPLACPRVKRHYRVVQYS